MNERDPFSAPGFSRSGDGDAQPLAPDARKALFRAKLLADTAGVPVYRTRVAHESGALITTNLAGPIERVNVHVELPTPAAPAPATKSGVARLVWLPEGFVITPRTPAAPNGYGMPNSTPGGPLRQVIINRFAGNQYPDVLCAQLGGGTPASANVIAGNLFYSGWEVDPAGQFTLGALDASGAAPVWRLQFTSRFVPAFQESEGSNWLCHRPMGQLGAGSAFENAVLAGTNAARAAVGRAAVNPPLRGREYQLSSDSIYQMFHSGVFAHSSLLFRDGHREFDDRVRDRDMWRQTAAENLAYNTHDMVNDPAGFGALVVDQWVNSPEHYAAMITDWAAGGQAWATMESSAARMELTARQMPPYNLTDPAVPIVPPGEKSVATQVYTGTYEWVYAAPGSRTNGTLSVTGDVAQRHGHCYFDPRRFAPAPGIESDSLAIMFAGRLVELFAARGLVHTVLAQRARIVGNVARLRIVTLERQSLAEQVLSRMVVRDGELGNFEATQAIVAVWPFPADLGVMSMPRISAAGTRVVFGHSTITTGPPGFSANAPFDTGYINQTGTYEQAKARADEWEGTDMWPFIYPERDFARCEELHFLELQGNAFVQVSTSSIEITADVPPPLATTGVPPGQRRFVRTCKGEYNLYADYQGEAIVYAKVVVDSTISHSSTHSQAGAIPPEAQATPFSRRLFGKLVFPNGAEFVFQDSTLTRSTCTGFFAHILFCDILNPGTLVHVRYTPTVPGQPVVPGQLFSRGNLVRTLSDCAQALADGNWTQLLLTEFMGVAGRQLPFVPYQHWTREAEDIPGDLSIANDFSFYTQSQTLKAVLVAETYEPWTRRTFRKAENLVGPIVLAWPLFDGHEVQCAQYRGESITGGWVGNTLRADKATPAAAPWFESSLDLHAITGLPDLLPNITPIGVL